QGALLESVAFDQIGFVFLYKPAILTRHFEQFGARVGRSKTDLKAEDVQFLGEADGIFDRFLGLDGQPQDKRAVNDHSGLMTGLREPAHLIEGNALLNPRQYLLIPAFITDKEQTQARVLEESDRVVIDVRPAVAGPRQAEGRQLARNFPRPRQIG